MRSCACSRVAGGEGRRAPRARAAPPPGKAPPRHGSGSPRGRGPRGRRPRFRPPGNLTPLLRLIALIALAILIVVLLAVWVEGGASDRKRDRYGDYLTESGA